MFTHHLISLSNQLEIPNDTHCISLFRYTIRYCVTPEDHPMCIFIKLLNIDCGDLIRS